jgi:Mrr N-terminal domain
MMPTIRIDDEVFEALQQRAQPLVDTPNSVLRREFGLDEDAPAEPKKATRAKSSELLPNSAYRAPVIRALARRGGAATRPEVIEDVGKELHDQFKPLDFEKISSGAVRWENRVAWQRQNLKEEGLIDSNSPNGLWTLSEAGWDFARTLEA